MSTPLNVGIFIFEGMTMLDAYAPLQVLAFVEQFNTFTFAKKNAPLMSDSGALLTPHYSFDECPAIDILLVPGGGDVMPPMADRATQDFLKEKGNTAQYVTSVCTGALILAEAGLLDGYRATTHWGWIDALGRYPNIQVVDERVAVDRTRITGGGVTAGIDFALTLVAEIVAPEAAQALQLVFEYRPQPPFDSGDPAKAPAAIKESVDFQIAAQRTALDEYLHQKTS